MNKVQQNWEKFLLDFSLGLTKDGSPVELTPEKNKAIGQVLRNGNEKSFAKLKEVL